MTSTIVKNVRVFDGVNLIGPTTVVIDAARIGSDANEASIVDGAGMTMLPGLIDTHIHLDGRESLEHAREWGVTTLLDMGTHPRSAVDELRELKGLPDIRSSYAPASAPGGFQTTVMGFPPDTVVSYPEEAAQWVAARIADGADYIKIIVEDPMRMGAAALDVERIAAIVAAAHANGLKTIAHATTATAIELAVNGGVDVVTHAPLDRVLDATTVQKMAERSIVSLPTLTMMQGTNMAAKCGCFRIKDMVTDYANSRESVTMLHQAGVTILAGTDANTTPRTPAQIAHGKAMHEELALLVEAGLSPIEALRAATSVAAHYFGLTDRGVIEVGRRADLLLVEGDPTIDIKATRNIRRVWCAGIAYTPVAAR